MPECTSRLQKTSAKTDTNRSKEKDLRYVAYIIQTHLTAITDLVTLYEKRRFTNCLLETPVSPKSQILSSE